MKHHRDDDEVHQSKERPDGAEDEEVDLRGRVGIVVVVIPPVCDYHSEVSSCCREGGEVCVPYAAVPSTMIAKTAWMMRRARTMVLFS